MRLLVRPDLDVAVVEGGVDGGEIGALVGAAALLAAQRARRDEPGELVLVVQEPAQAVGVAQEWLAKQPQHGFDINGNPLECRATTRRGTPCQRMPLAHNGYCPSHQHLAETEEIIEQIEARIAA